MATHTSTKLNSCQLKAGCVQPSESCWPALPSSGTLPGLKLRHISIMSRREIVNVSPPPSRLFFLFQADPLVHMASSSSLRRGYSRQWCVPIYACRKKQTHISWNILTWTSSNWILLLFGFQKSMCPIAQGNRQSSDWILKHPVIICSGELPEPPAAWAVVELDTGFLFWMLEVVLCVFFQKD